MKTKTALAIFVLLVAPVVCQAQAAKKIPVAVSPKNSDEVGKGVTFALKEAIRASQLFRLVDNEFPATARIVVHIYSVDGETLSGANGNSSIIAVTVVYDSSSTPAEEIFLNSILLVCRRNQIESCAKGLLPYIDEEVESLRKRLARLVEKPVSAGHYESNH